MLRSRVRAASQVLIERDSGAPRVPRQIRRGRERTLVVGGRCIRVRPIWLVGQAPRQGTNDVERDRSPLTDEERALYLPPPRLTPEQQERGLRALAELRRLNDEMRATQSKRPSSPPAWRLINEARDERSRQLG